MWLFKTTTVPVIEGAPNMINKETNRIARYLAVLVYIKFKILHFKELLIPLREYYQCGEKNWWIDK